MKLSNLTVVAVFAAALAPVASASVINFGPSNQTVTFTGLGANAAGQGTARVTWGSCVYTNGTTTCTVSAPFTGLGGSGTVTFVLSYPGNGPSPMNATFQIPGSDAVTLSISSGSFVQTVAENNGTTASFYYSSASGFTFNQPQCTGVTICTPGQVGGTPNATISGAISAVSDLTPYIRTSLGVISASSFGAFTSIAPATWLEIYGTNLATTLAYTWAASDFNGVNAPTALKGTTVTVGGVPAFIDYVSPTQVNAQVPSGLTAGTQPVVVTTAGGTSLPYAVQVNPVEPGMLAPPVFQLNGHQYVVALFPDGVTYVLPPGVTSAVPTARAKAGDTILLYGVGFGPVTPNIPAGQIAEQSSSLASNLQVSFGGTPAKVAYDGLTPNFVGLYQFNVVVPNVAASDTVPLTFSVGSTAGTQSLVIAIGN